MRVYSGVQSFLSLTYKASRAPFGAKAEQGYILGRENVAAGDTGD